MIPALIKLLPLINNCVLVVDDFDLSLHPLLFNFLFEMVKENLSGRNQILITYKSSGLNNDSIDDTIRVHDLLRTEGGESQLQEVTSAAWAN